jgi:hypothetical protein
MKEDMLQQQDWQKFGHPHGAAGRAGGPHWRRCPGERILFGVSAKKRSPGPRPALIYFVYFYMVYFFEEF